MAIEVNLEKYGHRKKGFLGFSWTAFFFNFWVPIFRADFKWFLIFIFPFIFVSLGTSFDLDFYNNFIAFIFIFPVFVSKFVFPFIYNKFYTKGLIKEGYLPPKDDDYSNAILKGTGYLEYTNEDLLDEEKIEKYRLIIEQYEKERKNNNITLIIFFGSLIFIIVFFIFMASY